MKAKLVKGKEFHLIVSQSKPGQVVMKLRKLGGGLAYNGSMAIPSGQIYGDLGAFLMQEGQDNYAEFKEIIDLIGRVFFRTF